MKYAVIGDGTSPHEHFVVTVTAESPQEALDKVAQMLINNKEDAATFKTKTDNNCSPTYSCQMLNENHQLVYELKTAPLSEI